MNFNATNLQAILGWIGKRIADRLNQKEDGSGNNGHEPIDLYEADFGLDRFINRHNPTYDELLVLMLGLTPHLQPDFFNRILGDHLPEGGDIPEFGGVRGTNHRGILPTGETAQFVIAGNDIEQRLDVQRLFGPDHWFSKERILWLEPLPEGEPVMSGKLVLNPEVVEQLTLGAVSRPRFSMEFPAEHIETEMTWNDLVLPEATLRQVREIGHWISHNDTLMHGWGMKKKLRPGYRVLFHGPPGTGKTLTATLLGKETGRDVFRIDLSRVISKYIGETEKNLSRLFDKAENKEWILFFDEADALFGKRTEIRDAHDKYANQETAYLLQRIEGYDGLVILASNQRGNLDDAFARRFQAVVHFPMPGVEDRFSLWSKTLPEQLRLSDEIDWRAVAAKYELSGAGILNVVHYCGIEYLADPARPIDGKRLETAIMREFIKEGKVV